MVERYRSNALAAVHETAFGLKEAGVLTKRTMAAFDELCLTPVERLSAVQIRRIRTREKASQAVFARISTSRPVSSANGSGEKNIRAVRH